MSNWFEHELDDDDTYYKSCGIDDEIWTDTMLKLGPRTLLWTHLHFQDVTEDSIKITIEDFKSARHKFINCGYPLVLNTFKEDQLIVWLDKWEPWIRRDFENYCYGWIADINQIANVDTLTDEEIILTNCNERAARDYLALVNLQVNWIKMSHERKLDQITPDYIYSNSSTSFSHNEIKKRVKTWKHIPTRYRDD